MDLVGQVAQTVEVPWCVMSFVLRMCNVSDECSGSWKFLGLRQSGGESFFCQPEADQQSISSPWGNQKTTEGVCSLRCTRTDAGKSTDSPPQCLEALEIQLLGRSLPAFEVVVAFQEERLNASSNIETQPVLGDPTDSAAFCHPCSLPSMSIKGVTRAE